MQIEDEGVGFSVEDTFQRKTFGGLSNLQEHVALMGGTMSVVSSPGTGTQLWAWFPLSQAETLDFIAPSPELAHHHTRHPEVRNAPKRRRLPENTRAAYSVVLADKNILIRQGLGSLLEADEAFYVAGEASLPEETIQQVEKVQPDVAIIDWEIGLNTIEYLAQQYPDIPILVLSRKADEAYVTEALQAGAVGYALKDLSPEELTEAVRIVAGGRRYLSPIFSERAIEAYINNRQAGVEALSSLDMLTDREREVFKLVVDGNRSREIAEKLYISPRTVETHRANMMRKLGLRNQADLLRYAAQRGLVSPED